MRRASRTAEYMALFRAIESGRPAQTRLFEDHLAAAFLSTPLRLVAALSRCPGGRRAVPWVIDRRWPGPRGSAVVRTRLIDDALGESLDSGAEQVVILGAGFDSRPYRLRDMARARVFEVDHPVTQATKRAQLERVLGQVPGQVTFVAMDFERDDLAEAMRRAGFRRDRRAVIVCEGVTNYLSETTVDQMIRLLAAISAPESTLVFTYVDRRMLDGSVRSIEASRWVDAVRRAGEPFTFGFDPGELASYLAQRGFELVSDMSTAEAGRRYFTARRSDRGSELYHVAVADLIQTILPRTTASSNDLDVEA